MVDWTVTIIIMTSYSLVVFLPDSDYMQYNIFLVIGYCHSDVYNAHCLLYLVYACVVINISLGAQSVNVSYQQVSCKLV